MNNNLKLYRIKNKKIDKEDLFIINNEINSIKNKNFENYFAPRFLVESKTFFKNKYQNNFIPNSKFNILINNNGK